MTPLSTEDFPYTVNYVLELLALEERQLNSFVRILGLSPRQDDETGRTIFTHRDLEQIKKAAEMQRQGDDLETIGRRLTGNSVSVASSLTAPPPLLDEPRLGETKTSESRPNESRQSDSRSGESRQSESKLSDSPRSSGSRTTETKGDDASGYRTAPTSSNAVPAPSSARATGTGSAASLTAAPPTPSASSTTSYKTSDAALHVSRAVANPGPTAVKSTVKSTMISGQDNITAMVEAVSQVKEGILKDLGRLLDDKLAGLDEVVVELIRCKSENDSLKKKLNEAVMARESLEHDLARFKPVQFGFYRKT
jgi:DNA-binding transcriptional MerR regulator